MSYLVILIWAVFIALILPLVTYKEYYKESAIKYKNTIIAIVIVFLPLIYMVAVRGWVADTILYRSNFLYVIPNEMSDIPSYMASRSKDQAFYFISALIKVFITKNPDIYFGIIAVFQSIALIFLFRNYSENPEISFFLFIASTDYFSWMFNVIRQFIAVCIILFATPFILKKRYIEAIIIIVIASLFHKSALIMIPILFMVHGKAWNKKTILFLAAILLAIVFVGRFTSLLSTALEDTQYRNVVSDYTNGGDNGTNPIRVLIYSIPAIISFIHRKKISEIGNPLINMCVNMSIISMGLYLISMVTSGIFIGRLPIYCSLYGYILLPWELNHLYDEVIGKILRILMIIAYCIFYYYQMHVVWGRF